MKSILNKLSFLTLLLSLLLAGCSDATKTEIKEPPLKVTITQVNSLQTNQLFSASGTIEAVKSANIGTRLMGYVSNVNVKIGDKVKKGDLLLSINSADLKAKKGQINAQITRAKSYFANAKKDYERFTQLFKENSASQKELDNITTNYEQAKAGLEAAMQMQKEIDANLAYADIKAPFDGVITGKMIDNGDLANPGMPLLSIENTHNYLVKTFVNENQIDKIHKGDADVLALASELDGIALLDDEEARGMAEIEGIEHHGTIYLLLRMMRMKLLTKDEAIAGMNEMIRMGWRCSTELYAEILMAMK